MEYISTAIGMGIVQGFDQKKKCWPKQRQGKAWNRIPTMVKFHVKHCLTCYCYVLLLRVKILKLTGSMQKSYKKCFSKVKKNNNTCKYLIHKLWCFASFTIPQYSGVCLSTDQPYHVVGNEWLSWQGWRNMHERMSRWCYPIYYSQMM